MIALASSNSACSDCLWRKALTARSSSNLLASLAARLLARLAARALCRLTSSGEERLSSARLRREHELEPVLGSESAEGELVGVAGAVDVDEEVWVVDVGSAFAIGLVEEVA